MIITPENETKIFKQLIIDMIDPKFKHKESVSGFILDMLERIYNSKSEFMLAYTDNFSPIKYKIGDKVRVFKPSIYNINWDATVNAGYAIEQGVYVYIDEVYPYRSDCYKGKAVYINTDLNLDDRTLSFNNQNIAEDNTIVLDPPRQIADLI